MKCRTRLIETHQTGGQVTEVAAGHAENHTAFIAGKLLGLKVIERLGNGRKLVAEVSGFFSGPYREMPVDHQTGGRQKFHPSGQNIVPKG